jgi:hypothetical protein
MFVLQKNPKSIFTSHTKVPPISNLKSKQKKKKIPPPARPEKGDGLVASAAPCHRELSRATPCRRSPGAPPSFDARPHRLCRPVPEVASAVTCRYSVAPPLPEVARAVPYRRSLAPPPAGARHGRLLPVLGRAASTDARPRHPLQMVARNGPCRISSAAPVGGRPHRPCWRSPAPSLLGARPRRPLPELARASLWPSSPVTGGEGDEWGIFFSLFICFYYVGNREGPLRRRKIKLEGLFTK